MSKAYVVFKVQVTNSRQYEEYKRLSTLAMQSWGAKVLVRGGEEHNLEGNPFGRVVILEFDNLTLAQKFYNSPQYRRARNAREGAAIMNVSIIEGV